MKKLLTILLLTSVFISGCVLFQQKQDVIPSEAEGSQIDTSDWKTYRNEDIGFEFQYPNTYTVKVKEEKSGFDQGKKRNILLYEDSKSVMSVMSFYATSKDYALGVGEGCCFYYSGNPIDVNDYKKDIEQFNPVDPKIYNISGVDAVRFYKINQYATYWVNDALLIPNENSEFSNILITGSTLYETSIEDKSDDLEKLKTFISNKSFLEESDLRLRQDIFEEIISTIKVYE